MFSALAPTSLSALAVLVLLGSPGVAGGRDNTTKPASDVTGTVNAAAPPADKAPDAPVVIRARDAQEQFGGARAAMEHALLLREKAPESDIAKIESGMNGLLDDLDAVEKTGLADSVKDARRLAREWHDTGMQILAPPAAGLTELPMRASVASEAEEVATALERLVARTAARTPAPAALASNSAVAAPVMTVAEPKAAARMTPHHVRRRAPAPPASSPMAMNEASARLMRDALPLFFPPAVLFTHRDDSSKR